MSKPKRRQRPLFDHLEDRRVPATWGIPWADPQHLTASFVPDGTPVTGQASQLYQTLDSQLGAGKWEPTILKALQTWAVNSNINIGLVADGGQAVGVAGPAQGDARFGDIRISAEPLPLDVAAITTPYSPANGTLSGDIILNSSLDFDTSEPGGYDLFTVALHEAGHVFGFADSADPSSFMYDVYQGPEAGLAPGAIPAIQALYGGTRAVDSLDGTAVSTNPAKPLNIPTPSSTSTPTSLAGDLATPQEVDNFAFKAPNALAAPWGLDVQVQTAGISLLAPKVTVLDASGDVVATAAASGPIDGGASVHLARFVPGMNYSVRVQGANGDVTSVGSYELTVSSTLSLAGQGNPTAGAVAIAPVPGSPTLTAGASITQDNQSNVYSFKTPATTSNGLTVNLQDWGVGLQPPAVTLYDALGNVVATATATSPASPSVGLHAALIAPNATYYVGVASGTVNPTAFGNYQLSVGFAAPSTLGSTITSALAIPWFGSAGGKGAPTTNTTLATAATLATPAGEAPQSRYEAIQGIDPTQAQQFYQLATPKLKPGTSEVMTASVQVLGSSGLLPQLAVFDQAGNPVAAQVLVEQDGTAVVQVPVTSHKGQYVLEVSSSQAGGAPAPGNFYLDVTFSAVAATVGTLSSGTLSPASAGNPTAPASTTLTIGQGELYSFVLAGSAPVAGTDAILQMTLVDSSGNVVSTLSTPASQAQSMFTCLSAGTYTILIDATSPSGQTIPPLSYTLTGTNLTDPIKVYASSGGGGTTTGS